MQLVLEAEPKHWLSGSSLPGATSTELHPFVRAKFGSVNLNLATLQLCRCLQPSPLLLSVHVEKSVARPSYFLLAEESAYLWHTRQLFGLQEHIHEHSGSVGGLR